MYTIVPCKAVIDHTSVNNVSVNNIFIMKLKSVYINKFMSNHLSHSFLLCAMVSASFLQPWRSLQLFRMVCSLVSCATIQFFGNITVFCLSDSLLRSQVPNCRSNHSNSVSFCSRVTSFSWTFLILEDF